MYIVYVGLIPQQAYEIAYLFHFDSAHRPTNT